MRGISAVMENARSTSHSERNEIDRTMSELNVWKFSTGTKLYSLNLKESVLKGEKAKDEACKTGASDIITDFNWRN